MMRNLKAFGLALVAMCAMSAMAASAASANAVNPQFTAAAYPAILDATGTESEKFTAFGAEVTCKHAKFESELTGASSELFVTPIYTGCHSKGFAGLEIAPVTVTHNGCNYRFHNPVTDGGTPPVHRYKLTVDVVCPTGKVIEVHVYSAAPHGPLTAICTITVGSQANLEGLKADVNTNAGADDVTLTGTVTGIKVQQHRNNVACPGAGATPEESGAIYHLPTGGVTAQSTNEEGALIDGDIG